MQVKVESETQFQLSLVCSEGELKTLRDMMKNRLGEEGPSEKAIREVLFDTIKKELKLNGIPG
jgi:hypothetical protein